MKSKFISKGLAVILVFALNLWAMEFTETRKPKDEDLQYDPKYAPKYVPSFSNLCLENEDYWLQITDLHQEGMVRRSPASLVIVDKKIYADFLSLSGGVFDYDIGPYYTFDYKDYKIIIDIQAGDISPEDGGKMSKRLRVIPKNKKGEYYGNTPIYSKPLQKCSPLPERELLYYRKD